MPPPPELRVFGRISTNSYGAKEATSRKEALSKVSTYRSEPKASYVAPTRERRCTPVDGREMPDSSEGGQRPQTLKSCRRSLKGVVAKRISVSRRASVSNFPRSAAL